jgi:hypothetical protein
MTDPSDLSPDDAATAALLRRAARDEAPPAAVRARAVALRGGAAHSLASAAGALMRRVVAIAVVSGSGGGFAPAYGVRGAAAPGRQWLFRADECEIDLRIAPRGERWSVAGQVFGASQCVRVELASAGHQASAPLGPTREFGFVDLPPGLYSLTLKGGDVEVVIPQVDIGTDASTP